MNNNYNNKNIDVKAFDAYLSGNMSDSDKQAFEQRLASDPQLKQDFTEHKLLVLLLQESGSEADKEFLEAMKGIDDEEFKAIVQAEKNGHNTLETDSQAEQARPQGRVVSLKKVYGWMSIAAVVVVVASVGMNMMQRSSFNQQMAQTTDQLKQLQQSNNDMKLAYCDALAEGHVPFEELTAATRGTESDAVNEKYKTAIEYLKENKTNEAISTLEQIYKVSDGDRKSELGYELVYAYIKAGDVGNAKRIIKEVKANDGNLPQTYLDDLEKLEKKISKPYF